MCGRGEEERMKNNKHLFLFKHAARYRRKVWTRAVSLAYGPVPRFKNSYLFSAHSSRPCGQCNCIPQWLQCICKSLGSLTEIGKNIDLRERGFIWRQSRRFNSYGICKHCVRLCILSWHITPVLSMLYYISRISFAVYTPIKISLSLPTQ